jgi:hypothetical protein
LKESYRSSSAIAIAARAVIIPGIIMLIDASFDAITPESKLLVALSFLTKGVVIALIEFTFLKLINMLNDNARESSINDKTQQINELNELILGSKEGLSKADLKQMEKAQSKLIREKGELIAKS